MDRNYQNKNSVREWSFSGNCTWPGVIGPGSTIFRDRYENSDLQTHQIRTNLCNEYKIDNAQWNEKFRRNHPNPETIAEIWNYQRSKTLTEANSTKKEEDDIERKWSLADDHNKYQRERERDVKVFAWRREKDVGRAVVFDRRRLIFRAIALGGRCGWAYWLETVTRQLVFVSTQIVKSLLCKAPSIYLFFKNYRNIFHYDYGNFIW